MSSPKVYFPNLNGVRFLAALVVMIHHIELTKYWFGQGNEIYTKSFIGGVFGDLGVILFFVLSGFLITYLLLAEYAADKTISIRNFYMRRILRIWPLYYLLIVLGLFVLPLFHFFDVPGMSETVHQHFAQKVFFFFAFMPNVPYALFTHVPFAEQAWSVGVEEQFYLLWPLLVLLGLRTKRLGFLLGAMIGVYLAVKGVAMVQVARLGEAGAAMEFFQFWHHFNIDCMAIGGIGAYLLFFQKERALKLIFSRYFQVGTYLVLGFMTVRGLQMPFITFEFSALLFAIIILNLAANVRTIVSLQNRVLDYLGKISYGLYMFHNILLVSMLQLINRSGIISVESKWGNVLYYALCISGTILVAGVSYQFYERRFIKMKRRFTTVVSGESASPTPSEGGECGTEKLAGENCLASVIG